MNVQASCQSDQLLHFRMQRSLPMVLQTEIAECGLACVAMIAGYHGFESSLHQLRQQFSVSMRGTTLQDIVSMGKHLGLVSRALKLEPEDLKELQLPCVLHWEMQHFVVLKAVSSKHIYLHDPAVGERKLSFEEADGCFTGIALEMTPTRHFNRGDYRQKLSFFDFWRHTNGLLRSLSLVLVLALLLQVFAVISPYYMQLVIDDVILRADRNLLVILAAGFCLLLLLELATNWLKQTVVLHLSSRLNLHMSVNVFHRLLRLPLSYFESRHMGDLVSRFASLNALRTALSTGLVTLLFDGILAVITLIAMLVYAPFLAFVVLGFALLYALLRLICYTPQRRLSEELILTQAKEQSHFMESMRAMQMIKMFEKESHREMVWQNKLAQTINHTIRLEKWQINFQLANRALFGIENIVIIFLAAQSVIDNVLTVGMLFAFISYKQKFVQSIDSLIIEAIEFKMLELHLARLADIVLTDPDPMLSVSNMEKSLNAAPLSKVVNFEQIKVSDLAFAYGKLEEPIWQHINVTIQAGQTVAIVGPSGCGKTTLLKCLLGCHMPTAGEVRIGGTLLQHIPDYRKQIAAVMQDDQVITGTIAENIAYSDNKIDMEKVVQSAHLACVHDDILTTAMQYNTLIGDMGTGLSGGQKQRILLARALYKSPKVLFMDEASSQLDVHTETLINQQIKALSITRIIVAHRPQTIEMADKVFRLSKGALEEIEPMQTSPRFNI